MPDAPHPRRAVLAAVMAGAADDQAAHGVAHQQDLPDPARPRRRQLVEQPGQVAAVVGHVPAGVVTDIDRRVAEFRLQPAAVRLGPARLPEPGVLRLGQAMEEDGQPRRGVTERVPQLLRRQPTSLPPARTAMRMASGARSGPSRSPVTAFSTASTAPPPGLARGAGLADGAHQRRGLAAECARRRARAADRPVGAPRDESWMSRTGALTGPIEPKARPPMAWCTCSMRDTSPANA